MEYEKAVQTMMDFTLCDTDVIELQSGCSLQIQNARFEWAFATYLQKFLISSKEEGEKRLEVETLEIYEKENLFQV